MSLLDDLRAQAPALRNVDDDTLKQTLRAQPEFRPYSDEQFEALVSGTPSASTGGRNNETMTGFAGDLVDATQMGAYNVAQGLGDFAYEYTGAGRSLGNFGREGAASQLEQMSPRAAEAIQQQIFESTGSGLWDFKAGEGFNPLTIALQTASLAGEAVVSGGLAGGGARAGLSLTGKVIARSARRNAAREGLDEAGQQAAAVQAMRDFASSRTADGVKLGTYGAVETAVNTGQIADGAYQEILAMPDEELDQSQAFAETYWQLADENPNASVEELRQQAREQLGQGAKSLVMRDPALLLTTGVLGGYGGKVLDDLVSKGARAGSGRLGSAGRQALVQGVTETGQGGMGQYSINSAVAEIGADPNRNPMEGVSAAGLSEGFIGGVMGGGVGALAGRPRTQESITQAREQAAAQGGDALDQATAGLGAEQQAQGEQQAAEQSPEVRAQRQQQASEAGLRIQRGMADADDLQALARGSSFEGGTRLRNMRMITERAEAALEAGKVEQASRLMERAENIATNLRSALRTAGTRERPMEGELADPEAPQGDAPRLEGRRGQLPPGTGDSIRGESPQQFGARQRTQQEQADTPNRRSLSRDDVIYGDGPTRDPMAEQAARRAAFERQYGTAQNTGLDGEYLGPDALPGRPNRQGDTYDGESYRRPEQLRQDTAPRIPQSGTIYGEGPVAGNANTGMDQPFDRAQFTDTGARDAVEGRRPQQQESAERVAQLARTRGRGQTTYLPDNTAIRTRFRVVEASELTASNSPDGRVNQRYPQELQPRDRTNANSQVQVRNIAARLNPERLGSSNDAGTGAPIIGSDGVVESGNGRTMAITTAYGQNSPQAERYREFVRAEAQRHGIDPSAVDEMQQPVLVRERVTNVNRADFARRANESTVAGMTAYEQAQADADSLTADDLQAWSPDESGDPLAATNRGFQRGFVQRLGNNEASRYTTRDGQATPELGSRMQRAVFAAAYQDPDMVEMVTEQAENMRNLAAGLQSAAADLAVARETGSRDAMDAIGTINDAVRLVRRSRQDGISVRELTRQTDAFSDAVPETTALLAIAINNNMRSRQAMTTAFGYIGRAVRSRAEGEANGALFADDTTNGDIFDAGFQGQNQDQRTQQRPPERDVQPGTDGREPGTEGQGQAEPTQRPQAEQPAQEVDDQPLLSTYTEQELAEREQAEEAEASHQRDRAQRAQADQEADDFTLSGSNRTADVAAAQGQQDLTDSPLETNQVENADEAESSPQTERIEDFGEKIAGARKDQVNQVLSGLNSEVTDATTLIEAFPAPNYTKLIEEGVDPRAAAFVAVMRAQIPAKPRKAFRLQQWMKGLTMAQDVARRVLDGSLSIDDMMGRVRSREYSQLEGALRTAELIAPLKPSLYAKASKWNVDARSGYSMFNGEKVSPNTTFYRLKDERGRDTGIWATDFDEMRDKAANVLSRAIEGDNAKPKSKLTPVSVYRDRSTGERFIAFKAGSRVIRLQGGFDSPSAAADYVTENREAIQQQIDAMRAGPRMRRETNAPREGVELREGDVTPADFQEAFGFRGVQFGNYVEGQRRQADLNRAYDALMDLSSMLGVPPKAMSLDGTLGLAFGARGKGGRNAFAAHYEPGQVVINLTKTEGAGSLAHEWFHALDNFIPHGQGTDAMQTELTTDGPARAELAERWREMRQALKDSGFEKRSREFDAPRSKAYFGTPVEMAARAFERYTRDKLEAQGIRNDYLVNISSDPEGPYPNDQEIKSIGPAFDRLMGTLEHRETARGVQLYSLNPGSEVLRPAPRAEDIRDALASSPELSDVTVIQSATELPPQSILMMALQGVNPRDVRGLFVDDQLYVIADNVDDVQEGVRTAVHEAVGHKGMRAVLGDDLDRVMLNLYRNLPNSKEGRDALREVRRDYPFLDPESRKDRITIAEEMVAHLLEKGHRPKAWQRAVAKIRELLRRLFPSVAWTYTDALALGEKSRDYLVKRHGETVAAQSQATVSRYSQRSGKNTLFTPIKQEAETYRAELSRQVIRERMPRKRFSIGRTPPVLAALGAPDLSLSVDSGVIYKATQGKHSVSMELVKQLPELLHDPIMVLDSATQQSALVVMVQGVDQQGRPVLVPLHLNKREARIEVNRVASAYGRHNPQAFVDREIAAGRLRYLQTQKGPEWLQSIRLQLPGEGVSQGLNQRIVTQDDIGNSDQLYALRAKQRANFEDAFSDFTDADRAAAAKIGSRTPPQRAMAWFKERADRAGLKIRQGMVDRYAALKEMDERLYGESALGENIQRSSWVLARMSNAANGALHAMLHNGRIKLNQQERIIDMQDGDAKGLGEVLGRLGSAAEIERFMGWIAGNRAARLAQDGRENLFDVGDINAMQGWNRGQTDDGRSRQQLYKEVFDEFQQYRDDVLAVAEQSGIITSEQREMWGEEFYVPFYRLAEDDQKASGMMATSGLSRQQAYKRLKGGTHNLNDLLQNTMMNFHHLLDASLKNQAAAQAIENAKKLGMAEHVPESNRDTKRSTFVMENGQKAYYDIDDPLVFTALTALAHPGMNSMAMKVMRGFKRVFTNLTTTTPQFMIANLIRDSLQASATSDVSKNSFKNVIEGGRSYKDERIRAQMLASGASFNFGHLYGNNPDELRAQLTRNMRNAKLVDGPTMVPNVLRAGWSWWNDVNNATENLNRAAIYSQNKDKGGLRAAFESRDLIDFSAHGAWPAVRVLIDIVPFLNARIQGLDKIYRSGVKPGASVLAEAFGKGKANVTDKQAAARFWTVTGAVTMATIALYLHNQDDEEYQKLEDWQKDTYWFFRAGNQAFFIPKPFEVGAMATLAERMTEQFTDDKATGKLFAQRLGHMMTDTFSFSPVPQMMQPALDIYANYDAFTGRPIEGMGMERLSPELRRRANTSKAAEWISGALNSTVGAIGDPDKNPLALSPVQVDHLIGGYFGQVGTWVASSGDIAWRVATGVENPAQRWYEYQPVRRFYRNLGNEDRYTKYGTIFYEGLREANRAFSDANELREMGRLADAAKVATSKRDMLALRLPLNRAQRRLNTINQQVDIIRRSNFDGEVKRQRIDRLNAVKNQVHRALGEQVQEARAR
ncbi:LPD5 domain-containing protein [Vreelandella aquamarina]|uniref:LPD38 domain-containing protein n=1 Tax=Vreelandella aquamarina TaxID=77097 RepID=UPI0038516C0B